MQIPVKIDPCPIVEASIGISFEPKVIPDAVFGIVYNAIKDKYPNAAALPILQLPEEIRNKDSNLINQPHYTVSNDTFKVLIGPRVLTLSVSKEYVGWKVLLPEIIDLFNKIAKLDIIAQVHRLGLRYINVFDFDIFEKVKLKINVGDTPLISNNAFVRAEIAGNNFVNTLQIGNNASGIVGNNPFKGSIIDIDTFTTHGLDNFFSNSSDLVLKGHEEEKKTFYNLLTPEFLKALNPTYAGGK